MSLYLSRLLIKNGMSTYKGLRGKDYFRSGNWKVYAWAYTRIQMRRLILNAKVDLLTEYFNPIASYLPLGHLALSVVSSFPSSSPLFVLQYTNIFKLT